MNKYLLTAFVLLLHFALQAQPSSLINNTAKLNSLLHNIYNDTLLGISVAVTENNKIIFEKSYGLSNLFTKEKITTATNFNIASLTKQFTALAILQLSEKGKLSLNDKISRFFPDMNQRVADAITIKNLLTHTSGIVDHYAYADTIHLKHAHNADVYNAIKNVDSLYFTPGTQFRYSNTGFCLLALIIERASNLPYNTYMQRFVFKPAGMLHTITWSEHESIAQQAVGYDWDSTQHHFVPSGANEHIFFSTEGDGGIYTSIHDYLQWLKALQGGIVFSKSLVEKARSIEFYIKKEIKIGYGFGWFVDENNTPKRVYHSGSNGGFRSYSFTIPQQGYSIAIFSNRDDIDIEEIVQKINNFLHSEAQPITPIEILTS